MENKTRRGFSAFSDQEGFAVVLAMVMVLVASLMAVAATKTTIGGKWRSSNYLSAKQALYAAEAGIQDGVGRLIDGTISDTGAQNDPVWNQGSTYSSSTADFTNSFTVRHLVNNGSVVKDLSGLPYYVIQATGYEGPSKRAQKTIETIISLRQNLLFNAGMTGCNGLSAVGRASIDSYDSSLGSYGGDNIHGNGSLTTCVAGANISLTQNVVIKGNVTATGEVTMSGSPTVVGDITENGPTSECDPLDVATYVESKRPAGTPTSLSLSGGNTTITGPTTLYYNDLKLSGTATFEINGTGPVTMFIDGDWSMTGQSRFVIGPAVKLTVYITGSANLAGNGILNFGPPTNLAIYSSNTGESAVIMSGNEDFSGAIYAPLGTVALSGNAVFYGAVRGKIVNDSGNAAFHYDEQLGKMPVGGIQGYTRVNWKEVFN